MAYSLSQKNLKDASPAWANSAAAGTVVNVDVPGPEGSLDDDAAYVVIVNNPGASALTVKVQGVEDFGGTTVYPEVTTIAVPAGGAKQVRVQGWIVNGGRLAVSNDAAIGLSGGFTANVRVRAS